MLVVDQLPKQQQFPQPLLLLHLLQLPLLHLPQRLHQQDLLHHQILQLGVLQWQKIHPGIKISIVMMNSIHPNVTMMVEIVVLNKGMTGNNIVE